MRTENNCAWESKKSARDGGEKVHRPPAGGYDRLQLNNFQLKDYIHYLYQISIALARTLWTPRDSKNSQMSQIVGYQFGPHRNNWKRPQYAQDRLALVELGARERQFNF
jgi:hypothetical protein